MTTRWKVALSSVALVGLLAAPVLAQTYGGRGPWGAGPQTDGKPLSMAQAEQIARRVVDHLGYPGLVPGHIMEFQNNFYVAVEQKAGGQGAFEFLINRYTGFVHPEPQSMMWNTEYGPMGGYGRGYYGGMMGGGYGGMMGGGYGGMMGGYGPGYNGGAAGGYGGMMGGYGPGYNGGAAPSQRYGGPQGSPQAEVAPIALTQARKLAQKALDAELPGATLDKAIAFPGYYTIDVAKNGKVIGMLSVNAYSGQVWYHTWHGAFIREKDLR